MTENQVALVTGGTGFVGSNLIRRLISKGWRVHAIVRPNSDLKELTTCADEISLHVHDGSTEDLLKIMSAVKPDVVFHLVSLFLSGHTPKDVARLIQSNVLFSAQLVEAMNENGIKNLVNTGTSWQHYENKEYNPVNLYAATKQAFEAILQYYIEAKAFKVITLKLFDTYGPNDPRPKLFHLLEKTASTQEPLAMSPGDQLIDLVHIDDVIDAYLLAAKYVQTDAHTGHRKFAVTSGKPIKLKQLVQKYSEVTGKAIPVEWGARPYRPREVMVTWDKGELLPGWISKIQLNEGLSECNKNQLIDLLRSVQGRCTNNLNQPEQNE
jgi:nucleoside-diphosphate-sugar epimerase